MKYPHLVVFLVFFLVIDLSAQIKSEGSTGKAGSYVNLSPLPFLDPFVPRLRLGYIQHLNDHWKLGIDMGYGDKTLALGRDLGESYKLFELRPELYYVLNPKLRTIKYLSAEFFYIDQENTFIDDEYEMEDGRDIYFDKADFIRKKYGLHLKYGLFLDIRKNVGINFYGGVGFRFKNNEYTNLVNPEERNNDNHDWNVRPQDIEGKNFTVNPTLGFRFYYKL